MNTLASTKAFADKVKNEVRDIDVVLLNAGILNTTWKVGEEGFEETIQISALSTPLLALLLLPWIKEAGKGKAHLGFVSTGFHRTMKIDSWPRQDVIGWLSKEENWSADMYGQARLLMMYAVNEIAKLALGSDNRYVSRRDSGLLNATSVLITRRPEVIVNAMCPGKFPKSLGTGRMLIIPGLVKSDLARAHKTSYSMTLVINTYMNLFAKTTEGGARTLVRSATTAPEENGKYITDYQSDKDYKQ